MPKSVSSPFPARSGSALATILKAGFVAGTCDITAATIQYLLSGGKSVVALLQFVASGVFGKAAFTGGVTMAAWGLLFHYGIALAFAAFFFLLYRSLSVIRAHRLRTGMLYGVFVWMVMNLLVLPLSQAPALPFTLSRVMIGMGILIVAIGLPISRIVHRHFVDR